MTPPANVIEISLQPGVESQIDAALALRSAGRLEDALRALAKANESDPYLNTIRGEIEFALRRYQEAALSYFAVVHAEPANANAHYNLGAALEKMGREPEAIQHYRQALLSKPGDSQIQKALARARDVP